MKTLFGCRKKRWRKIFFIAIFLSVLALACFAQGEVSIEDRVIGSTFKTLAKGYVLTADIAELKRAQIEKLKSIEQEKFNERYARIYEVIKDLPYTLKAAYNISERMTPRQAVKDIESLDKAAIYAIIDSLPDKTIADEFRRYLSRMAQQEQKGNIIGQIKSFWDGIIRKLNVNAAP